MKDAKGHGSDPRGAHAAGIDQVGRQQTASTDSIRPSFEVFLKSNSVFDASKSNAYQQGVIDKYRADIRAGNYIEPLVVAPNMPDGKPNLLDGHHRLLAYKAEGVKEVPVRPPTNQEYKKW